MYPHIGDRHRLIQRLLRMERERYCNGRTGQHGLGQRALARVSGVSQAAISNIENLERSADNPKRRVSREDFLKTLIRGLELPQERIDSILWLFDGNPVTEEEIRGTGGRLAGASPESYGQAELRGIVFEWLEELLEHAVCPQGARSPGIITTGDAQANLAAVNEIMDLEQRPGLRMLEMRYPSFISLPQSAYPAEECAAQFRSLNEMRLGQIQRYGERSIHYRGCVEDYVESGPGALGRKERRAQLQRWIELLECHEHPYYEVRLSEEPTRFELNLKTAPPVLMGAMVNEDAPWEESNLKAQWVKVFDQHVALSLLLQFERNWDRVPQRYNTNAKVAEFLRYVLDKSP